MSSVYVISDLHLGAKNIEAYRYMRDPSTGLVLPSEEQHELLFESLMQLKKRETLILCGDTAMNKEWVARLKDIPCKVIHNILGNHDNDKNLSVYDHLTYSSHIHGLMKKDDTWYSHAPVHTYELRGLRNVHGHAHNYLMLKDGKPDRNYINVCADYTGFKPITRAYALSDEYYEECCKTYQTHKDNGVIKSYA